MRLSRFSYIAQPVFPNQKSDEKIFVFTRRHFIDFLPTVIVFIFLLLIPIVFIAMTWSGSFEFGEFNTTYVRDFIILISLLYWLTLEVILITSWINFYYNVLVVSNERVVEIAQNGLFSHEVVELVFAQIEDVTTSTKGFLSTIFGVGDIEIQTAGTQRNFFVKKVPHAQLIIEIIHSLDQQAKVGVQIGKRDLDLATIGVINGTPISRGGKKPAIMNFDQNLKEASALFKNKLQKPRNIRERIDRWWLVDRDKMLATFGRTESEVKDPQKIGGTPVDKPRDKTDEDMLDL